VGRADRRVSVVRPLLAQRRPPASHVQLRRRHFIQVVVAPNTSLRGGFAVTVERFQPTTLFDASAGGFSEKGSVTLSTLWNIIFPGARPEAVLTCGRLTLPVIRQTRFT